MADAERWQAVATRSELARAGRVMRAVGHLEVLCVQVEGEIRVWSNVCPHKLGPLAEGTFADGRVRCPWHAWSYDLRTGRLDHGPGFRSLTASAEQQARLRELRLQPIPFRVEADEVLIDAAFDPRPACAAAACAPPRP